MSSSQSDRNVSYSLLRLGDLRLQSGQVNEAFVADQKTLEIPSAVCGGRSERRPDAV